MNAHDAMKIKLEVLRAVGASPELLAIYCPVIPKRKEGEDVDECWVEELLEEVEDCLLDEDLGYGEGLAWDIVIFDSLMSTTDGCPYCVANATRSLQKSRCEGCSYSVAYGNCVYDDDSQHKKCKQWVNNSNPYINGKPENLAEIISELKGKLL